jgi:hypothetical protein
MEWDGTGRRTRPFIDPSTHAVFYYRQYIAGGGYQKSESNQLITNLKKRITAPESELYYKEKAIDKFVDELVGLLKSDTQTPTCMTWIPPSKVKGDPEYDDRMEQVVHKACRKLNFTALETFQNKKSRPQLHYGNTRNPYDIAKNLQWCDSSLQKFDELFIVDDVLTTGASFRAMHDLIHEKYPSLQIVGLFWAITVDEDP